MKYLINTEDIDKRILKYYKTVHQRFVRGGYTPGKLKRVCEEVYMKVLTVHELRRDLHPTSLYVFPPKEVIKSPEMFMFRLRNHKAYPTLDFCNYLSIEQINEVTYVNTLRTKFEELQRRSDTLDAKIVNVEKKAERALEEAAKTQQALIHLINGGFFSPYGVYPPGDLTKVEKVLELAPGIQKKPTEESK